MIAVAERVGITVVVLASANLSSRFQVIITGREAR
jgi:hypothetical protein